MCVCVCVCVCIYILIKQALAWLYESYGKPNSFTLDAYRKDDADL